MPHIYYQWAGRIHRNGIPHTEEEVIASSVDEFTYFGVDGDTTPLGKIQLSVVPGETDEQQRYRVRQALGRRDVHWW